MMRTSTLDRLGAADALDLALLQHAQDLGLRRERHVADFVEEDRAAVAEFELAQPLHRRAGERPPFVAEEFALDQIVRDRGAVDRDERFARAGAGLMDRAGEDFLARSRFAVDKYSYFRWCNQADLIEDALHVAGLADHAVQAESLVELNAQ
jgi:hypothetical protein